MIKVFRGGCNGPIIRGMTLLTTNEIAGLVVFWAWENFEIGSDVTDGGHVRPPHTHTHRHTHF